MSLSAGDLRHRVELQQRVDIVNTFGETETVWDSIGMFWASIQPLSVREMLVADKVASQVTTRIMMRYSSAVDASMRILHNGTIYGIQGVQRDPDSGLEWMTLPCNSGIADN